MRAHVGPAVRRLKREVMTKPLLYVHVHVCACICVCVWGSDLSTT